MTGFTRKQLQGIIQDGDVLAFESVGLISRLIRLRTSSHISHVGFACWSRGIQMVLESREGNGVRLFPLEVYLKRNPKLVVHVYKLQAAEYDIERHAVIESAYADLGQDYASPWQFLRSWGLITKRVADRLGIPADVDADRLFCSEYVTKHIRAGGYIGHGLDIVKPAAQTDPGDVVRMACLNRVGYVQWPLAD